MVDPGTVAVVHVVVRDVEDGEPGDVFETTDVDVAMAEGVYEAHRDYVPIEFRVGGDEVPRAVDEVVREMETGEERTVYADPERAFGPRREGAVVEVDRHALEDRSEAEAAVGELVGAKSGETGWITDVGEETVTVDFNHEFAGERVAFEVRLLDVREPGDDDGTRDYGDGDPGDPAT